MLIRKQVGIIGAIAATLALAGGVIHRAAAARQIVVAAGGNLQAALDSAAPGDTIILEAGATFVGPISLPNKGANTPWISIQSSRLGELPEGVRVGPQSAGLMPKIVGQFGHPALVVAPGANHYKLLGIEATTASENTVIYDVVRLGEGGGDQNTLDKMPKNLVIDRSYIHALGDQNLKRGIALNSGDTEITNSYISGFKVAGQEAQAICGWNGTGPYRIINNYLEGAGENVMFGGSTGGLAVVPTNIEIRRNHFYKPWNWAGRFTVKNLLELKNARNVVIEGNVFENNWADAQVGYAILFTPRRSDSGPLAVVENVLFVNNIVKNTGAGINILGAEYSVSPDTLSKNIRVVNNLFENISQSLGEGAFLKIGAGAEDIVFDHNTVFHPGNITKAYEEPTKRFIFTNNILAHNDYGVHGDGAGVGNSTISQYFPGSTWIGNVIVGAGQPEGPFPNPADFYPFGNFFPHLWGEVGFVNQGAGNYRLGGNSPYKGRATDGKDVGCDINQLEAALSGSVPATTPTPSPAVTPTPTPPSGSWTFCASEGQNCLFSGTRQVRYGANGTYAYGTFANGVNCTNAVFGDPLYGVTKSCAYATTTQPPPPPPPGPADSTWTWCAVEGQQCNFTGTRQVRYGANGTYAYGTFTNGVNCTNAVFGDPLYGVGKSCATTE